MRRKETIQRRKKGSFGIFVLGLSLIQKSEMKCKERKGDTVEGKATRVCEEEVKFSIILIYNLVRKRDHNQYKCKVVQASFLSLSSSAISEVHSMRRRVTTTREEITILGHLGYKKKTKKDFVKGRVQIKGRTKRSTSFKG